MSLLGDSPTLAIALIIAFGATSQWLAWRVRLPAILPLLVTGFLIGPVFNLLHPTDFIPTELLFPAVSLAVGVILFEGGLTLRFPEVREVLVVVRRLFSVGALITWLGCAVAAYFIIGLDPSLSALFGALIIVTGPTVIGPLIRNVRPTVKVANVLKWEGILIDPVGALVAVLVFEYLLIGNQSEALGQTFLLVLGVLLAGGITGFVGGYFLAFLLRRHLLPDNLVNVVSLALVFTVFAVSNSLVPESGLLATTLMGMVIANLRVPNISEILSFKEDLTLLFISILFIVLAANIELEAFLSVLTWQSFVLIAVIMLVVRPINIFVSAAGSTLNFKEKLFLSWIAPRGIVAASVTSLFAFELTHEGFAGAEVLEPLVFLVIVCTVVLNSLTAKPFAQLLGVAEPDPQGFLILGAHPFARRIGSLLKDEGFAVQLADTNWSNVAAARVEGLNTYYGSLLSEHSDDEVRLSGIGKLLAMTSNDEANALAALKFTREFGSQNVYQLEPSRASSDRGRLGEEQRGRILFTKGVTYNKMNMLFSRGAKLKKTEITEQFNLKDFDAMYGDNYLPLFIINNQTIKVISEEVGNLPESNGVLVSLVLEPQQKTVPVNASSGNS